MLMIAFLIAWLGALAAWVGYIEWIGHEPWSVTTLVDAFLWLGAPLLVTVPCLQLPALLWLSRRSLSRVLRRALVVATSGMVSLPLALLPVLLSGGTWRDVFIWYLRPYLVLYAAFGVLSGVWYSVVRLPRETPRP